MVRADMLADDLPKAFSPGKILVLTMMKTDDGEQNKQDGRADNVCHSYDHDFQ